MSGLVTMKVKGDTNRFRRFLDADAHRPQEIFKAAQAADVSITDSESATASCS